MPLNNHNKKTCGSACLRCWGNKLKHQNKQAKSHNKKNKITRWDITGEIKIF
jgi:hypothetical protein